MDKKKPNLPVIPNMSQNDVALIRETYAKDLTDTQFRLFMAQVKAMDLNPFTKEIYGMNLKGRLVLMTSIQGLRKIAHSTGCYLGCKVTVQYDEKRFPLSATAIVKKLVQGKVAEFEYTAMFDEFTSGTGNWQKMPVVMITKVAEANALRMAFPKVEQVHEQAEQAAIEAMPEEQHHDVMPDYEHESQAVEPGPEESNAADVSADAGPRNSGEFLVKFGPYKNKPTRLKDIPKEMLEAQLKWAYSQQSLKPDQAEYIGHIEEFLGGQKG